MKYRDLQDMFSYNMIFIQYYRRTYEIQQNKEDKIELLASEALTRQGRDAEYLMELDIENLLFPYYFEAGLTEASITEKRSCTEAGSLRPAISGGLSRDTF